MGHTLQAVRLALAANLCLAVALPFAGVQFSIYGILGAMAVYVLMGGCGITATFHRYYSHRSFEFRRKWVRWLFTVFGTLAASGSALGWAAVHRAHHRHTDTPQDPHSPDHHPVGTLLLDYKLSNIASWSSCRDLVGDPIVAFTHRYYVAIVLAYVAALSLIHTSALYYLFVLPSLAVLLVSGVTNYVQHKDGAAINVPWIALLNFGEGWHKAHHEQPKNYDNSRAPGQIDLAASIIRAVS